MNSGPGRQQTLSLALLVLLLGSSWSAAARYYDAKSLAQRLVGLAQEDPNLVRVHELARSRDQRSVWLVELGTGPDEGRRTRPALLVVAGIEGNDLVGPFVAVSWVEHLAQQYRDDPALAPLLNKTTIYVVPCLNPDALERYFARPQREGRGNDRPRDDDHDGLVDEDPSEDLNGDGLITRMRVEDKEGEYILDPNEPRLLLKADPVRGEKGAWKLLPEGIDNDHDRRWNEDGPDGVNFNRNWPHNYRYFSPDAGPHPVSEVETRALADFVVAHSQISLVLTYGASDNLRRTPKAAQSPGRSRPMEALDEKDVGYYEAFGKLYRHAIGLGKEMECLEEPGTFSDWMYFQRGRLSLAVRPWDAALARALTEPKEAEAEEGKEDSGRKAEDGLQGLTSSEGAEPGAAGVDNKPQNKEKERGEKEREQLRWFDHYAPEAFLPWQAVEHPDCPGRRVEVGGYRPFALTNPPPEMLGGLAAKQGHFLTELLRRLPRIEVGKIECRLLDVGIYEIEIHVVNTGFLPTALAQGQRTQEVYPTRVILDLEPQCFLAGVRTTLLPPIEGSGGSAKARYTIRVSNRQKVSFSVVSMLAGQAEGTIELLQAAGRK